MKKKVKSIEAIKENHGKACVILKATQHVTLLLLVRVVDTCECAEPGGRASRVALANRGSSVLF